jgi:predicted RecB family nuclease
VRIRSETANETSLYLSVNQKVERVGISINISADLFDAFLKCPTKCWLRAAGESGSENAYAEWVKSQTVLYRATQVELLLSKTPNAELTISPALENFKAVKWQLVIGKVIRAQLNSCILESELHAVERVPPISRGRPAHIIPVRFVFRNKLCNDDKLLLAFDAFALSVAMDHEVNHGTIRYGYNHTTLRVRVATLTRKVQARVKQVVKLLSSQASPELVLNRHCPECEFQPLCRQKALAQDELTLISGLTRLERKKLNDKGIFTVKQLSYTFLPRRRPKSLRYKPEKYHPSLKALAMREKRIYIVGNPVLKIDGTPVYLDVESLPDRDFYYLIGLRIGVGKSVVQHSLWADQPGDEAKIYAQFLDILSGLDSPLLIHYGSFETHFFEQLGKRYGNTVQSTLAGNGNRTPVNLLSMIFGHIYFPTYSNSLKDIASWLGFSWSEFSPLGLNSVVCRYKWEKSQDPSIKASLLTYNAEDCQAIDIVTQKLLQLHALDSSKHFAESPPDAVNIESLKKRLRKLGLFVSPFKEFERAALASWWDYERDRIYLREGKPVRITPSQQKLNCIGPRSQFHVNKTIIFPRLSSCPFCGGPCKERDLRSRMLYDLKFGRSSVKRWVARCRFHYYWCCSCDRRIGEPHEFWPQSHLGRNLVAYVLVVFDVMVRNYENIDKLFSIAVPPRFKTDWNTVQPSPEKRASRNVAFRDIPRKCAFLSKHCPSSLAICGCVSLGRLTSL